MLELSCHNLALTLTQLSQDEIALVMKTSHPASCGSCPHRKQDQRALTEWDMAQTCLVESKDLFNATIHLTSLISTESHTKVYKLMWGMICKLLQLSKYCKKLFA